MKGSNGNGNGSGGDHKGGSYFSNRLRAMLAEAEAEAAALRRILAKVDTSSTSAKRWAAGAMLADALAIDAARVQRRGKKKKHKPQDKSTITRQRERTAKMLADFSRTEPRDVWAKQRNTLSRYGYIARKGDGWIRTEKSFSVEKD